MSEDPVRKYLDGRARLEQALSKVNELASVVGPVGNALESDPLHLIVSNIDVGFPPEVAFSYRTPTLDAHKWPSAKQIAETLAAMHKAIHEVSNLWASVSVKDRANLTPPTKIF